MVLTFSILERIVVVETPFFSPPARRQTPQTESRSPLVGVMLRFCRPPLPTGEKALSQTSFCAKTHPVCENAPCSIRTLPH